MAQNRQPDLNPANSSSSEEEEEEGSEEEEEEGSESSSSEQEDKTTSPPTPPVAKNNPSSSSKKPDPALPGSSDDDESGSESDSEIKPISSKPMTKPRSKPIPRTSPPTGKSAAGVKRQMETESDSRRAKRKVSTGDDEANGAKKMSGDDPKKQLFQRLWSEDDEIVILNGMIDYRAKKGADPVADMNAFHEFIKKSLHIDVSKTQLSDKVRRLKKKYENNAGKEKKGKDRTFAKPHEQKAYELSKKIWGREGNNLSVNGTEKKNQSQKAIKAAVSPKVERFSSPDVKKEVANVQKDVPKMDVENNVAPPQSFQMSTSTVEAPLGVERIIRDRLMLIEGSKKMELDEKWKRLHLEEVELYLRRVELIREQTSLVLESLKSAAED
ncbi:hypothetical protein LguiA_025314 [Lonicera macranthoides]